MTEELPWHSNIAAVVVHPMESSVWIPDNGDPTLRIELDDEATYLEVEALLQIARERWDLEAIVLRCLDELIDRETRRIALGFVLTPRAGAMPRGGQWQLIAALTEAQFPSDPAGAAFRVALRDIAAPLPITRRPWSERGWFAVADTWAIAALADAGLPPDLPSEQLRTWGLSTVNRYRTSAGDVYFKAAAFCGDETASQDRRPLLFANEAVLLSALDARFPGYVPRPVAIDPDRVWMLTRDAGPALGERHDIGLWETAIRVHARHQRELADRPDVILNMGCLDRRLDRLAAAIEDLMADGAAMAFLEPPDRERFRVSLPTIRALIAEVAAFGIPDTFIHGDLHPWNIGLQEGRPVFFDWTDACFAHPFFDLASFLASTRGLKDEPDARERLKSAYLDEWPDVAPRDALERCADACETLAMAHQAVSYQHMLPWLEGPSLADMSEGIPFWVKRLLDRMS